MNSTALIKHNTHLWARNARMISSYASVIFVRRKSKLEHAKKIVVKFSNLAYY